METSQVKVRYVGYSADYDEWRARADIVDLSDSDPEDDSMVNLLRFSDFVCCVNWQSGSKRLLHPIEKQILCVV